MHVKTLKKKILYKIYNMSASDALPLMPSEQQSPPPPPPPPPSVPPRVIVKKPTMIQTVQDETVASMKVGFTFATALAWNEAFKSLITRFVVSKDVPYYNTVFALVVTLFSILFMMFTKRMKKTATTKVE